MIFRISVFALLFFSGINLPAQDLVYDVFIKNKSVGEIKAQCRKHSGVMSYYLESEVSYSLLFSFDYFYTIKTVFNENGLHEAEARNTVNNKLKAESFTRRNEAGYRISLLNDPQKTITKPITYSMVSLYFKEPKGVDMVYSERYGEFLDIDKLEDHKYRLYLPDGREIVYHYENGNCVEIEVDHSLTTLYFKLREKS